MRIYNSLIITLLIMLAMILPAGATPLSFESSIEGFDNGVTSTAMAYSGTHSFIPAQSIYSAKSLTLPASWSIQFMAYIPSGAPDETFYLRVYSGSVMYAFDQGYPQTGYWGVLHSGSWQNSAQAIQFNAWNKFKIEKKNGMINFTVGNTLIYAGISGSTDSTPAAIWFKRGSSTLYYIDEMNVLNNDDPYSGVWSTYVETTSTEALISACVGDFGGYYKLKSSSGTILRSSILGYNDCMSSSEDLSYLHSLESGNWIAYVIASDDHILDFTSFNVNPTPTPTPSPSPSPTPQPTTTGQNLTASFISTPSNAVVSLDGIVIGNTPINHIVIEGLHTVSFSKTNYITSSDTYFISSTGHEVNVTLTYVNPDNTPYSITVHRSNGSGSVSTLRNNEFNGVLTQSETNEVFPYIRGDSYSFYAVEASGYTFKHYCLSTSCTNPIIDNPYVGTATSNFTLYAYFEPISTIRYIQLKFAELYHGSVSVYVNDAFQGVNSLNMSVLVHVNDSIKFMPNPNADYIFKSCTMTGYTCTGGATFTNIQSNGTYTIYWGILSEMCNGQPCNQTQPGQPGTTPLPTGGNNDFFQWMINGLSGLIGIGTTYNMPPTLGIIITLFGCILFGGATYRRTENENITYLACAIIILASWVIGFLPGYILLLLIAIVVGIKVIPGMLHKESE